MKSHFQEHGYEVRTLDRAKEDLTRPDTLKEFVSDASVLVHLAGKNRATDDELYTANTVSTLGLIQACATYNIQKIKILFASSMQVYEPTNEPVMINEKHQVSRRSAFSNSKLLAEDLLRKWSEGGQINAVAMRISNVYGPGCRPNYNSVIATFIERASRREELEVVGGSKARDFIHIGDVVDAVMKIAESSIDGFEALNICTGKSTTISELGRRLKIFFPQITIKSIDESQNETHLIGDPSKAEKKYGFRAKISLETGLRKTIEYALQSPNSQKDVRVT